MDPVILAYLPVVSPVATLVVVVLGVFFSNRHVDDNRLTRLEERSSR
jgi:hypothetical protein